jgi:tetratricopeptide (TPR) repeat protein
MKKLLFPIILTGTVLLGGVLAYSLWRATPLTSQAYFDSGKTYYDQEKYPEAIIQFLNAVRKDAQNRDARYYLALSFVRQQDLARAVAELRSLLEYYPEDVEANLQLGGIFLAAGRSNPDLFRQAQELASKILSKDPNHAAALVLSGNASAGLQDYRASIDLFEKALSVDPQNFAAFLSLGATQVLQKNYKEAEQAFLKALEVNPKDRHAMISLANYYRAVRDTAKAESIFNEVTSLYPSDKAIYLQVVEFYHQAGRFEDVERVLRDAQTHSSQTPEPSLILADFYRVRDRDTDARELLLKLKEQFPQNIDVAVKVALDFLQEQPARARSEIDEILKIEPRNPVGHVLLGEFQFLQGQYDEAVATFNKERVLESPFPQVHFFLGNIALRKGQRDQAIFHYQKSLGVNGRYVPARVALAEVLLSAGRVAEAKDEIRKALETRPNFLPARLLKAAVDNSEKNFSAAEQELTKLAKEAPDNALVYRQMAVYHNSRGQTAEAEKNLLKALELRTDSQGVLRDLTLFYIRTKQYDKALQRLNAIPDSRKEAFHYEMLGLVHAESGKSQEGEAAFKKALDLDPERQTAEAYLFAEYLRRGRSEDALKQLDQIIAKSPSNAGAYFMKGQIYQAQGKVPEAKAAYTEAVRLNSSLEAAANNLAYILAEEGTDLQTALGYAQTARQRAPENPNIADTLGWIYYKMGNYVLARDQLQFAVSKDPGNPILQYHLGMIYKANKQPSEAAAALKRAIGSTRNFGEKSLAQAALADITK